MPTYSCVIPIAGHAIVEVEAASEEEAISKAFEEVTMDHIEEWEALKQFNSGNVCHCPSPWEVEVDKVSDDDEDEATDEGASE
jgi:hypothetical protein